METLKRDWSSTLKLRDVLVTISCLLIQPNPASALNETAGKLASEDWDGFCRRAKLMTDIHAAVPRDLAEEVKEAQMRGEEAEEKPVEKEVKREVNGKGKEKANITPAAVSKVQQTLIAEEDEENRKRRSDTVEVESDPESDWIPGPVKSPKPFAATIGRENIFGIKGLDESMQLDTPPHTITPVPKAMNHEDQENIDDSDPFITVPSKRTAQHSFNLRVPPSSTSNNTKFSEAPSKDTPELLKFSHANPFSAIQPNNQTHPLLKEFSWSWQDSEIMRDTGTIKDGPNKAEVRKRMAGEEFEERRKWEMKKFKKTGFDIAKYNRGEFGARTGVGRL